MTEKDPFPEEPELFDEEGDIMAFAYGLKDGFLRLKPIPGEYKSAEANKYYYYPGFIVGYVIKVAILAVVSHFGIEASGV